MEIDTESLVYIIVDTITAFFAIIGNSLVCLVILKSSKLKKKPMYFFVLSLAFADISVGLIAIPLGILTKLGLPHNAPYLCIVMLSFIIIPTQISIFNLMTVSIERYLAIRHPHFHYTRLTRKKLLYTIVVTWFLSTFIGFLSFLWNKNLTFSNQSSFNIAMEFPGNQTTSINQSSPELCQFMQIIDENYLLFNFLVCVLLPLLVCAVLYFLIYQSLFEESPTLKYIEPGKGYHTPDSTTNRSSALITCSNNSNEYTISVQSYNSAHQVLRRVCCGSTEKEKEPNSVGLGSTEGKKTTLNEAEAYNEVPFEKNFDKSTEKSCDSSMQPFSVNVPLKYEREPGEESKHHKQKRKKEVRAAAVLGIIVLSFAICWLPLHIINTVHKFSSETSPKIPSWVFCVAILLSHANSAINVFLYSWRLKAFRDALNHILCKRLKRNY